MGSGKILFHSIKYQSRRKGRYGTENYHSNIEANMPGPLLEGKTLRPVLS
jgi:hypothetical protein